MSRGAGHAWTIQDVAQAAEVSVATVSRILNGNPTVNSELAIRVRSAIAETGYQPSRVARSLRRRTSATWALVIPDVENSFFTAMVRGVEDVAHASGSSVYLCNSDDDLNKERRYLDVALSEQVAGIILAPASEEESDLRVVRASGTPVVTVDRRVKDDTIDSVLVDNVDASAAATKHLLESGFRRIACIVGPHAATTSREREQGYLRALGQFRGKAHDPIVMHTNFKYEGGYAAVGELARSPDLPDALLLGNNLVALGALERLRDEPDALPGHIGLLAFDDSPWFRLIRPSLSAVVQPTYEIGQVAGQLLRALIQGRSDPPAHRRLATRLELRESSRRPSNPKVRCNDWDADRRRRVDGGSAFSVTLLPQP